MENHTLTSAPFYIEEDYRLIDKAKTFETLLVVALRILKRMPQPVTMIFGPTTSGGLSSVTRNLERLNNLIMRMLLKRPRIFSQMPFEERIQEIREARQYFYCDDHLMDIFYRPMLASGYVETLYFIFDWKTSVETSLIRAEGIRLGLKVEEYI